MDFLHAFPFLGAFPNIFSTLFLLLYTDPGSGAMMWQLIAAFFVSGLFYVTFAFRQVKSFARKMHGLSIRRRSLSENFPEKFVEK